VTGVVGILLALVAGFLVVDRRRAIVVVVLPFLAVLAVQTWGIASGRAVSPPSTVNRFPDLVAYYVVQLIILGLALAIALEIVALRSGAHGRVDVQEHGRPWLALVINCALSALMVAAIRLDRPLFDPGSTARHSSSGHPPVIGVVGIGLSVVVCVVLGVLLLGRRWRGRPDRLRRIPAG
jgi:hypothetical protein